MRIKRQPKLEIAPNGDAEVDSDRTPLDWPRHTGRLDRVLAAIAVRKKRQRRRRIQTAVGGAVVVLIAFLLWLPAPAKTHGSAGSTGSTPAVVSLPERRTLPDGSVVELKDGSEIAVDFGGALRRVALLQGEAHFQVARDPERPFVVGARGIEFRAVGTAFAVQLSGSKVEMLVTEGRVAVERASVAVASPRPFAVDRPVPAPLAVVEAGKLVAVEVAGIIAPPQITSLSLAESVEKLAWRVPRLELNDTPLAEAVASINRHNPMSLELADAEMGKVGISGVLRADNLEPLLRMLESNYGIRAEQREPGKIVLRRGQ